MGRNSSESEEEKKKHKKKKKRSSRSRSGSASVESRHSSKNKKSKKKKKRRSRSASSTRSRDRPRSRSRSRDKHRRRSRSNSRGRYSRSPSRDRRRRSRSKSYDSHSRSSRRSRSPLGKKSKSRRSNRSEEREDPCLNIPGFADMAPSEQAKIRMNMALKAAAAADEKIKGDNSGSSMSSMKDSLAFSQAVQDIESSGFSAGTFKSGRNEKRDDSNSRDEFMFGTAGELRLDGNRKPVIVDVDKEELAHPSLYSDPEEKLDKWIHRLTQLRRKKLEGRHYHD